VLAVRRSNGASSVAAACDPWPRRATTIWPRCAIGLNRSRIVAQKRPRRVPQTFDQAQLDVGKLLAEANDCLRNDVRGGRQDLGRRRQTHRSAGGLNDGRRTGRALAGLVAGAQGVGVAAGSPEQRAPPRRSGLARSAGPGGQEAAGAELGVTALGGWVPSDLRRFLPLAVFLTCLAEMVFLPTRFFFDSAISILLS